MRNAGKRAFWAVLITLMLSLFQVRPRAFVLHMEYLNNTSSVPFYLHGLNLTPAWITNHILGEVRDEKIYPLQNVNGFTVDVWE